MVKDGWQELANNYDNIKEVEIEFEEKEANFKTYRKVVSLWTNQGEIFVQNLKLFNAFIPFNYYTPKGQRVYPRNLVTNKQRLFRLIIDPHFEEKLGNYVNDKLI